MPTDPPTVDWDRVKGCLAVLHRDARPFLSRALLIGGAACWFYRNALRHAGDPDFTVPRLPRDLEDKWLSRDLDFTGIFSGDAMALMPQHVFTDTAGRRYLSVDSVRLGFAQAGLTIDPEEARLLCRVGRFTSATGDSVEFFVADPVTLYREKLALTQKRNSPADALHLALLTEYLRYETCQQAARLSTARTLVDVKVALNALELVRDRAREVLNDDRVRRRIETSLATRTAPVNPADEQFLRSLVASHP